VALSCHGDTPDKINDLGSFGTAEVKTKAKMMVIFVAIAASVPVMGYLHGTDHLSCGDHRHRIGCPAPPVQGSQTGRADSGHRRNR
jgi:hypothetical protein